MAKPIIKTRGLGLQLGLKYLLKDINWDIEEKSRWLVLGMNGSGKTTLLSILSGYQTYNHGEVFYKERMYSNEDIFGIRRKMGWISNSFFDQIYRHESVLDVLLAGFNGKYGVEEKLIDSKSILFIKELLKMMGLENCLNHEFCWLSKGEKQTVLIIRALLLNPEILVFDEPMTGLDILTRESIRRFIELIAERKQHTMIYVTHHFDEVSPMLFDKCMLLKYGSVYRQGTIEEIFQTKVISDFLGVQMNVTQDNDGYYKLTFNGRSGERK